VSQIKRFKQIIIDHFDGRTFDTCASRAGSLEFKSWASQILHSVANCSPPLQHLRK